MFDDTDDWPSGVPVAGTLLVTCLVVAGAFLVGGYADVLIDGYGGNPSPQASFAFEHDEQTSELVVEHRGGNDVEGRNLYVIADGRVLGNFSRHETVSSGDEIVVSGVTRDDEVRIVWWDGPRVVVLARWP